MTTRKRYSGQFKADLVVELLKEDKSPNQLASEHGIHPNPLREWRKVALGGLPQLFERDCKGQQAERAAHEAQIERLYSEIGRLSSQLSWLQKKSGHIVPPGRASRHG